MLKIELHLQCPLLGMSKWMDEFDEFGLDC
jgi:hypothetical protein